MISVQNQKSNPDMSFEDVSKLFSLPLTEAADILGVSTSALKKICNENGLERWPHRKYLAGKSIEEIKMEAAKEKSKVLGETSPADRQKGNLTSFPSSNLKDKTAKSLSEMSKSQSTTQQPGSRIVYTWRPNLLVSGLPIETSTCLDEFKFGFPSNGLSKSNNKWWGRDSDDQDKVSKDDLKISPKIKQASEEAQVIGDAEKEDITMGDSCSDVIDGVSLTAIRKQGVDEGRRVLRLGVMKKFRADKLGEEEKILFRQLFQTSFPMDASGAAFLSDTNNV